MNFFDVNKVAVAMGCLVLTGCPVTVRVTLTNEFSSEIVVLYSTGYESKINPGKTEEVAYNFSCFKVKAGDTLYEYRPAIPPDDYFEKGIFSSSIYAVFTAEKELKIYKKDVADLAVIELGRGCEK